MESSKSLVTILFMAVSHNAVTFKDIIVLLCLARARAKLYLREAANNLSGFHSLHIYIYIYSANVEYSLTWGPSYITFNMATFDLLSSL